MAVDYLDRGKTRLDVGDGNYVNLKITEIKERVNANLERDTLHRILFQYLVQIVR